jgi:hypothetical protein
MQQERKLARPKEIEPSFQNTLTGHFNSVQMNADHEHSKTPMRYGSTSSDAQRATNGFVAGKPRAATM